MRRSSRRENRKKENREEMKMDGLVVREDMIR